MARRQTKGRRHIAAGSGGWADGGWTSTVAAAESRATRSAWSPAASSLVPSTPSLPSPSMHYVTSPVSAPFNDTPPLLPSSMAATKSRRPLQPPAGGPRVLLRPGTVSPQARSNVSPSWTAWGTAGPEAPGAYWREVKSVRT